MYKKPRILVVGSFMMDLIASTKRAPNEGETVVGIKFQTAPGGKGANQAVQCARLGAETTMIGCVGDDAFGKLLTGAAKAAGVDVSHVLVDKNESSGVGHITLEVSEHDARNRITVCPGANFKLTVNDILFLKDEIKNFDILMLQLEIPMDVIETVAGWAYAAGVPVMLNPAPAAALSDKLLSYITYLSPNEHEATLMSCKAIAVTNSVYEDSIKEVSQYFIDKGVKNLLITLGENGSVIVNRDRIRKAECVKMSHVTDTTAAGDSYVASFCTALAMGLDENAAMDLASYASAITVSRMGAMPSIPTVDEVRALMIERNYSGFDLAVLDILKGE